MKIAMFTDHFYPELGGIQDSVALTARSLGSRGHSVEIFAPWHPEADFIRAGHVVGEPDLGRNVRIHRRTSVRVASSTQQSRAVIPLPTPLFERFGKHRPDVIHSHSFFGLGLEALLIGRVLGVPVVGTNHTNVHGFGPYIPVPVERAADWVAWYYNRCQAITAPSRSVFDDLGHERMRHVPSILSNPIDTGLFHPADPAARIAAKQHLGLGEQVIAYAGRLAPEKNIDTIFHALARLPETTTLALAGHGSHEQALRALASELGIAARVAFLGTLAPSRLAELFGAAELFAMMSTTETQSMASLQAMACGLPVVAPLQGALSEYVGADCGRLTDPHDPQAVAQAMADLLQDEPGRLSAGAAARIVAGRHSVDAVTDAWESIYQGLLPKRRFARSLARTFARALKRTTPGGSAT